jgi:hypothetical protein
MVWESFSKPKKSISERDFWLFIGMNFLISLILNQFPQFLYHVDTIDITLVLFICTSILAVIKLNGISSQKEDSLISYMNRYDYLKLLFISIIIGIMNLPLVLTMYEDTASINSSLEIIIIYCYCLIPFSFIVFLIIVTFFNKKVTSKSFIIYFVNFLLVSLIVQFLILRTN